MSRLKGKTSITIEHVAHAAGVSRQTVSRVINNAPNVKPAVKKRIEEAIETLGYVPSLAARRLRGARSYIILAINDRDRTIDNWRASRGNDWVDQMLFGGMTTCEKFGYHMLFELVSTSPQLGQKQLDGALSALRPDGVILTPPHSENEDLVALLERRGIPYGRMGPSNRDGGINVSMDEVDAARAATQHLINLGHRNIAFLSGSAQYSASDNRVRGYLAALMTANLPCPPKLVEHGDFSFEIAAGATRRLMSLPTPPTAIIAGNDEMAFAVLHVANDLGLSIPDHLSVISFEDTPGIRFAVPPLTAIRQPTAAMASKVAELLIKASMKEDVEGDYVLPYELMVRQTTAAPSK